jgi:hypothetical protein
VLALEDDSELKELKNELWLLLKALVLDDGIKLDKTLDVTCIDESDKELAATLLNELLPNDTVDDKLDEIFDGTLADMLDDTLAEVATGCCATAGLLPLLLPPPHPTKPINKIMQIPSRIIRLSFRSVISNFHN